VDRISVLCLYYEIQSIKEKLRDLEFHTIENEKWMFTRMAKLAKIVVYLSIATFISSLFSFLLIGHIAKYI
jgi:hypothetical protein